MVITFSVLGLVIKRQVGRLKMERIETTEFIADVKKGLAGLYNLSPGTTIGPYFSWSSCECCGSRLGGDRYDIIAIRGKKHTDPKETLSVCVDCFVYLFT